MKIKLTTLMSGPQGTFQPGTEMEVDAKQGRELVDGHYATEIKPPRKRGETTMLPTPENAMLAPTAENQSRETLARIAEAEAESQPAPEAAAADADESHPEKKRSLTQRLFGKN